MPRTVGGRQTKQKQLSGAANNDEGSQAQLVLTAFCFPPTADRPLFHFARRATA
jgi:hypothetical protein